MIRLAARVVLAAACGLALQACEDVSARIGPGSDFDGGEAGGFADVERDLGTLGGANSFATGVNASGVVVGGSEITPADPALVRAFRWTAAGGMRDLGTLGGSYSTAGAVNDAGWIAGVATTAAEEPRVVLWDPAGQARDLGAPAGTTVLAVTGINDDNVIVGSWCTEADPCRAFLLDGRGFHDAEIPGESYGAGINDAGDIAGSWTGPAAPFYSAFLLPAGGTLRDLGAPTGNNASGNGLDSRRQVVGWDAPEAGTPYELAPVRWRDDGSVTLLGTLGGTYGFAAAVNDAGAVVGGSMEGDGCCLTAPFYWTAALGIRRLGGAAGRPGAAQAISDSGHIAGWIWLEDGSRHAATWAPPAGGSIAGRDREPPPAARGSAPRPGGCFGEPAVQASRAALLLCLAAAREPAR